MVFFAQARSRRVAQWPFLYETQVEWRDLDGAGHVNHAVYLTYMESARTRAHFAMTGARGRLEDLDIILARAVVDYRSQADLGETLVVEVRPGRVGQSSYTLFYRIHEKQTKRLVAEGETVQVCFDYAKQEKKPIPAAVRAALEAK